LSEIEALEDNCHAIASFGGKAVGLEILIEWRLSSEVPLFILIGALCFFNKLHFH
jgi:hypothetical protein